ncbi:unnamed protein product [Trichogramma brassicae]|uniref:Uncharacterized protein n=1 Tax=Trichogramma brassicae TaxID=86971 RepID=A0A6H5I0Z0_9HYME|nr:unnamed protein product [Trichogramma brassicae]
MRRSSSSNSQQPRVAGRRVRHEDPVPRSAKDLELSHQTSGCCRARRRTVSGHGHPTRNVGAGVPLERSSKPETTTATCLVTLHSIVNFSTSNDSGARSRWQAISSATSSVNPPQIRSTISRRARVKKRQDSTPSKPKPHKAKATNTFGRCRHGATWPNPGIAHSQRCAGVIPHPEATWTGTGSRFYRSSPKSAPRSDVTAPLPHTAQPETSMDMSPASTPREEPNTERKRPQLHE